MTDKRRLKGVCHELYVGLGGDPQGFDHVYGDMEKAAMESIKGAVERQQYAGNSEQEVAEAREYMRRKA